MNFDCLDSPGGHIFVCLVLILLGAGFAWLKLPKAEDIYIGAVMVLFAAMRGTTAPKQ